jgi:hypothetical protein
MRTELRRKGHIRSSPFLYISGRYENNPTKNNKIKIKATGVKLPKEVDGVKSHSDVYIVYIENVHNLILLWIG